MTCPPTRLSKLAAASLALLLAACAPLPPAPGTVAYAPAQAMRPQTVEFGIVEGMRDATIGGVRTGAGGDTVAIPAAKAAAIVDPTGCGDAYRAGLLYGLANDWDWERTGRLASTLGALKISSRGGQNHAVNRERVAALYAKSFGASPW